MQAVETLNPNFVRQPRADGGLALSAMALAAISLAAAGALFASTSPDGLQRLTETLGIASRAKSALAAPLAEYQAGFLPSFWLRRAGAGLAGLALIYAACALFGRMVGRQRSA